MRLYEIVNKLVPMYFVVDRKTRKLLGFYGYYDPVIPSSSSPEEWKAHRIKQQKIIDAAKKEIKSEYPNGTIEIHYYHYYHYNFDNQLKIGDRIDIKGNKIPDSKPKTVVKNFLDMALDLLREFAGEKLDIDPESAGDTLDVYHENFKTSSGIPVYFIQHDLQFFYMGILPENKTTSIIEIFSNGMGSIETEESINGSIYLIEFDDGRKINKNKIPTLFEIPDNSRYDRSTWKVIAHHSDFETLLGVLLDIVWGRIGTNKS